MKILRLTAMWALLMAAVQMSAHGRYIYADSVDVKAGQEAEIVVKIDFNTNDNIIDCNFNLQLPEGVTLTNPDNPTSSITVSSEAMDSKVAEPVFAEWNENGSLRLVVKDQSGQTPLRSTHCELLRIAIKTDVSQTVKVTINHVNITNSWGRVLVKDDKHQWEFIYADSVTIEPGEEAEIVVNMDVESVEPVAAWDFYFTLPKGIEPTNPDDPSKSCTLSEELLGEIDGSLIEKVLGGVSYYSSSSSGYLGSTIDMYESSLSLKSSHGELLRVRIKSKLSEPLTFTPQIRVDYITNVFGDFIINGGEPVHVPDHRNYIYVAETKAIVGTEATLSVNIRNEFDIEGFAFDLSLPTGMTVLTDADGDPMVSLSEERTTSARTNTFRAVKLNSQFNDLVRVIAASSNGSAISAGDGEVCKVRVLIGVDMEAGTYTTMLRNVSFADTEARNHDMDKQYNKITVLALPVGDANGDKTVNVADMTAIAHHILGRTPEGFSDKAADANQDGQINVADYTAVAHLLLYGSIEAPAAARIVRNDITSTDISMLDNTVYIAPVSAMAGDVAELSVRMKNNVEAEGFQFSLTLPEGVTVVRDDEGFPDVQLSEERTTGKGTNTFASSLLPDGTLRVMGASTNGSTISAGDGKVCTVKVRISGNMAAGSYTLLLKDVAISDTNAKSHDVAQVEATLTVTDPSGIETVYSKSSNGQLFDLQGRKLPNGKLSNSQIRKGVYIRDGRKYQK